MTDIPNQTGAVVISAEQLRALQEAETKLVILEIQRDASGADPSAVARIPGAHLVNVQTQLVGEPHEDAGMNPLPTAEQLQREVERWGIDADSAVVVYTREGAAIGARGWWTLTWAGVPRVHYLDGGLAAWTAAGGAISTDAATEGGGTFVVKLGSLPVVDSEGAAKLARTGVLIDVRGPESYAAAHVPGAVNQPSSGVLTEDGFLKDQAALREYYDELSLDGQDEVGTYCGGATSATLSALALANIGVTPTLYAGSMSAWQSDPERPVATGAEDG